MKRLLVVIAFGALSLPVVASAKPPAKPDMTGKEEHAMRNCPSTVAGAATVIENRPDGVVLTITAKDAPAAQEIQERASMQANVAAQPARGAIEHTGEGTGSGQFGFCPGMVEGTLITVDNLADGARLVVRSQTATQVPALQQSTRARLRRLEAKR